MATRNELLLAAKEEFLCAYLAAFDQFLPFTIKAAIKAADNSSSSLEQHHYLAVRNVLRDRNIELRAHLRGSLEKLLRRSLQTAYSAFRPNFALSGHDGGLSLIETAAFEGELRLVAFTDRFRNEAEDQLRDLNIRTALLFNQVEVKEREVPFRPYLVSRSLADASEAMGLPAELTAILTKLLATSLESAIDGIYASVNSLLAQNGIAADLPLKIKKSPNKKYSAEQLPQDISATIGRGSEEVMPLSADSVSRVESDGGSAINSTANAILSAQSAAQFLQTIKSMTDTVFTLNNAQSVTHQAADRINKFELNEQPSAQSLPNSESAQNSAMQGHQQRLEQLLALVQHYRKIIPEHNISPAQYRSLLQQPAAVQPTQTPLAMHPLSEHALGVVKSGWLSVPHSAGKVLRKFMGAESQVALPSHSASYMPPTHPHTITVGLAQLIDTLSQNESHIAATIPLDFDEMHNRILEQRPHLAAQSQDIDEQMTIDVVGMLFDFILRDGKVSAEARVQLGRLQFLMLKLALRDPALLAQKKHPVRVLVNWIGSISASLKRIGSGDDRVSTKIRLIVDILLNDAVKDLEHFTNSLSGLLMEFDEFVAEQLRDQDEKLKRAVQVIENEQSRTQRFAEIAAQMAEILSGVILDDFLHAFLSRTWVEVIDRAEDFDRARTDRFRAVVPDLIWSIAPKVDEFDRQQLSALLPVMISTIREGLLLIGWKQTQQKEVLGWLFDAHTRAVRSINVSFQIPSLALMHSTFEQMIKDVPVAQSSATDNSQRIARKALMDAAIRQLDTDIQSFDNYFDGEDPEHTDTVACIDSDVALAEADRSFDADIRDRLHNGIYIEIKLGKTATAAQLSWISADASNLILKLDGQITPLLMSVRVFQRLMATQRVRFREDQPLFERAMQLLLDSAELLDQSPDSRL